MDREKPRKGLGRSLSIKSVKNVTKVVKNATKATIDKIGDKKLITDKAGISFCVSFYFTGISKRFLVCRFIPGLKWHANKSLMFFV